jgi:hypothetical protein
MSFSSPLTRPATISSNSFAAASAAGLIRTLSLFVFRLKRSWMMSLANWSVSPSKAWHRSIASPPCRMIWRRTDMCFTFSMKNGLSAVVGTRELIFMT